MKILGPKIAVEKRWDCFVRAVQTGAIVEAIQRGRSATWASAVVMEAMFIPPEELPDDLVEIGNMAKELVMALMQDRPYPEWYKNGWVGDEW